MKANAIMRTYTLHHLYPVMEYRWVGILLSLRSV
nr:MAG TPA: hypothetical protein [Caudoviricetes sp.]